MDAMRVFGWCCIAIGALIACASPIYASYESESRRHAWVASEESKARRELGTASAVARLDRLIKMMEEGLYPIDTFASPWPVVGIGLGVSAFGVIILALRRPRPQVVEGDLGE